MGVQIFRNEIVVLADCLFFSFSIFFFFFIFFVSILTVSLVAFIKERIQVSYSIYTIFGFVSFFG